MKIRKYVTIKLNLIHVKFKLVNTFNLKLIDALKISKHFHAVFKNLHEKSEFCLLPENGAKHVETEGAQTCFSTELSEFSVIQFKL